MHSLFSSVNADQTILFAPTCFGPRWDHPQGVSFVLGYICLQVVLPFVVGAVTVWQHMSLLCRRVRAQHAHDDTTGSYAAKH
jgi:hypothetical protein